jgi:hypothetical protein
LLEVIGKHDPQFHITKRASSRIDQIPGKRGDFLVDEIPARLREIFSN